MPGNGYNPVAPREGRRWGIASLFVGALAFSTFPAAAQQAAPWDSVEPSTSSGSRQAFGTSSPGRAEAPEAFTLAQNERAYLEPSADGARVTLSQPASEGDMIRHLEVEVGKSVFLQTEYPVKRVSVGSPKVVDVMVLGQRELQLLALEIGETNVVLWGPGGVPQAALEVSVGTPYSAIEAELRRLTGSDSIQVDSAGYSVVLKGFVPTPQDVENAVRVAQAFFPEEGDQRVVNLLQVGGVQEVMIEVVLAEMSRSVGRRMGTNFAASITSGDKTIEIFSMLNDLSTIDSTVTTAQTLLLSDNVNLIAGLFGFGGGSDVYKILLDLLYEKGMAKVLAEPTLVARSGETASFLVGGEIPIPIAQGGAFGSITIEFKEFGVAVNFTPTVFSAERIHMDVISEVSEPDLTFGTSSGGVNIPAFNTRRAATAVEVGDGQSFAIAGLLSERINHAAASYPWLGEIPILGNMFRSSEFQKEQTELVVIVTPRLVKPLGEGPHPLPTDHYVEPNDWEFYFTNSLEGNVFGRDRWQEPEQEAIGSSAAVEGGVIGGSGEHLTAAPTATPDPTSPTGDAYPAAPDGL